MNKSSIHPITSDGLIVESSNELKMRIREIFKANFYKLSTDRGMTQRLIAEKAGVEFYELNKYATMRVTPKPEKVAAIAKALDVSPDALVPGYVTAPEKRGMRVNMQELETGNIWIEFAGAFDRETANKMIAVMAENKIDRSPD